jgi:hypothetical protein
VRVDCRAPSAEAQPPLLSWSIKNVTDFPNGGPTPVEHALRAAEAGAYLAHLMTLPAPVPARKMWSLARLEAIPFIRLNRGLWFRPSDLRAFVAAGGTPPRRHGRMNPSTAVFNHTS